MLRLFPLRRSFSLDLAPDDSNSNFFLHVNDESNDDHNNHHHHQHHNNTSPNQCPNSPQQQSPSNYAKMSFLANPSQTTTITNLTTILTSSSTISSATTAAITTQRLSSVAASSLSSPSSPTSSSLSPSPSSSGPASSCSIHPINEEDEEEDDDEEEEGEEEEEEEDQNHNNNNTQSRNNEHANNDHHQHPNHHHHLTSSNMSSAIGHWTVDEIDDALAADFDGSLSGLGIELGTASFNMSEALMALPSLSSLKHNLHHHHHHHNHANGPHPNGHHGHQHSSSGGGNNNNNNNNQDHNHHSHSGQNCSNNTSFILASSLQSIRNHPLHSHDDDDDDDGDRNAHQNHHHHHQNQLATSLDRNSSNNQNNHNSNNNQSNNNGNNGSQQNINSNNNQSNNSGNGNMDEKPIAVVHGKKNRLAAYGNDDEQLSTNSIKRFCLNTSEREQQLTTITTTATAITSAAASSSSSSSSLSSSTASTTSSNNHPIHLLIPNNAHHLICDGGDPHHPHHHHHHHHGHIHLQNHQCNENCLNNHGGVGESLCHLRHSSSVPDLRSGGSTTTATIGVGGNLIVHGPSSNGVAPVTTTTTTTVIGGGAYSPQATLMNSSADSSPTSSSSISTTPTTTFFPHLISSSSSSPTCLSGGQIVNGGVGFMMDHHHHRSDPHSGAGNVGNSVPTSVGNGTGTVATVCNNSKQSNEQSKFQYVLGASTSMAIKMNEETMTYLNQGQSYEIKLKKVGDLSEMKGKMLKTILRVCFHDRRLQYIEKELIEQWKEQRPSERVLEVDVPLSYGINDVRNDLKHINRCEFYWDPTKETGVFIRINCISTEFTPKKHGGEKGVPFRVLIETYSKDDPAQCLHAASCQVKVFKPKGADRKHKTDREKMNRKPVSELEKYQSSYDCTVFTDCSMDSFVLYNLTNATTFINDGNNYGNELVHTMAKSNSVDCLNNDQLGGIEVADVADQIHKRKSSSNIILSSPLSIDKQHSISSNDGIAPSNTSITNGNPNPSNNNNNNNNNLISDHNNHQKLINNSISQISLSDISDNNSYEYPFSNFSPFQPANALTLIGGSLGNGGCNNNGGGGRQRFSLTPSATWEDTQKWLKDNRFDAHLVTFENFSGTDFFQLTKEDLIQICGLTDGIRLFNALHLKNVKSKLSLYVCLATDEIFRAIYLDTLTLQELQSKLIYNLSPAKCNYLRSFCIMGPSGVKILMTDDVVRNLIDESLFIVDFTKDFKGEFHAVMKPYNQR